MWCTDCKREYTELVGETFAQFSRDGLDQFEKQTAQRRQASGRSLPFSAALTPEIMDRARDVILSRICCSCYQPIDPTNAIT